MPIWYSGNPVPNPSNAWSNSPIVGNVTAVRKQHLEELREALEDHSIHYHIFDGYVGSTELPDVSFTWNVPTDDIIPDQTHVSAGHWTELRAAVEASNSHYHFVADIGLNSTTLDLAVPSPWSTGMAGGEKPRKAHIDELRASIGIMHNHTHTACCDSECGCVSNNPCTCQEQCENKCQWFD